MLLSQSRKSIAAALLVGLFFALFTPSPNDEANASGSEEIYLATEVIAGPTGSLIYSPVAFQGKLYFSAETPSLGRELYVFDGTSTSMVVDFLPGPGSGMYDSNGALGVFNNRLLLIMNDGTTGYELYQFDGTTISLVVDAFPGPTNGFPRDLIEYGGKLYFQATTFATNTFGFVWDYNSPPQLLSQAHAGFNLRGFFSPALVGNDLFFVASPAGLPPRLVKFDGTSFTELPIVGNNPTSLIGFNGGLVYYARVSDGFEPWFFDGTNQTQIADLNPGTADGLMLQPVVMGNQLIFRARTNATGFEMWRWDGTNPPVQISDLNPGAGSGHQGLLARDFGGKLVFLGDNGAGTGIELWTFDGTTQARAVTSNPIGVVNYGNGSGEGAVIGNTLYFVGTTAATGREIFAYGIKPQGYVSPSVPQPVTLTYSANGGSGSASISQIPGSITLDSGASFSRDGFTFQGWSFDQAATTPTYLASASFNLTQSATIYAVWAQNPPSSPSQGDQPAMPPIPVLSNVGSILVPVGGNELRIMGTRLDGVSAAFIGGFNAPILAAQPGALVIKPPKLEQGIYDLELITNFGRVTYQGVIQYQNSDGLVTEQSGRVTLDRFQIAGFAPGSALLNSRMRAQLGKRVQGLQPLTLTCIGQTMGPRVLRSDRRLALQRGDAVCRQLSRWFGISSYQVKVRNHLTVGERFRSTVVELSWVDQR